jgi:glutathione S-transferase
MTLNFYTHPKSRGRIVRWMLEECGADYVVHALEYGPGMHGEAYRRINPMGKVPAIEHNGQVVTECAAICAYLADVFPGTGLAPAPAERGDYYRWLFFASGPLESAIVNQALGVSLTSEQKGFAGYGSMDRVLTTLERALQGRDFIAGKAFTAADVYVGSQIGFGLQFNTIEKRDAFVDYWDRLKQRPAHLRANALDDALLLSESG